MNRSRVRTRRQHKARAFAVPKHAGRPNPWTQVPWNLLGMLFIASLFLASWGLSPAVYGNDAGTPPGHSDLEVPASDRSGAAQE